MAKKILLADDSLTIQKVVELTFSDSDYELICVSNGQRALDRVREDRPDLILADAVMPEKNGYEVCEAIKGDPATTRIPVVLLSGTFEPFDRERAERIGADAIVSKPFDSHQLLAQVDALLERPRGGRPTDPDRPLTTAAIAVPPLPEPPSSAPPPVSDEPPFDVGFSEGDFTAAVRLPPARPGVDPFEEDYGRGDVDSAIEAFEKAHPRFGYGSALEPAHAATAATDLPPETAREPQWLREEPYSSPKAAEAPDAPTEPFMPPVPPLSPDAFARLSTVAISRSQSGTRADEMPTAEFPRPAIERATSPERRQPASNEDSVPTSSMGFASRPGEWRFDAPVSEAPQATEISALDAQVLFDVGGESESSSAPETHDRETEPARQAGSETPAGNADAKHETANAPAPMESSGAAADSRFEETPAGESAGGAVPGEIEMLAQRSSIPELTQMLSSVRSGGDMSEEQIERLATRVVEKLSDRIVREIAWEVIPDMAELVIKQRIKELESGIE
ncbi:MAG: response regulator [Acidobacteriota bacterium]